MVDWTFNLISHPLLPWASAGLIVLWGLLSWLSFRSKVVQVYYALEDASRIVETTQGQEDFSDHFEKIDQSLTLMKGFGVFWSGFRGTLLHSPGQQRVLGSQPPKAYFNFNSLVMYQVDFQHYRSLPVYLIGGGLLFTFIGFSSALYYTYQGLSSPDLETVKGALNGIFSTAAVKFSASIAGLLTGLIFSRIEKAYTHNLERKIVQFCGLISDRVEWTAEENIFSDQTAEMNTLPSGAAGKPSKNSSLPQDLMDRLTAEMSQATNQMEDQVVRAVQESLKPLIEGLHQAGEERSVQHETRLEEILKRGEERLLTLEPQNRGDETVAALVAQMEQKLNDPAFTEPLLSTVREEVRQIQEQIRAASFLEPLISALHNREAKQGDSDKETIPKQQADLSQLLQNQAFLKPLLLQVREEMERVTEGLGASPDLEPAINALKTEIATQGAAQQQWLEQRLMAVTPPRLSPDEQVADGDDSDNRSEASGVVQAEVSRFIQEGTEAIEKAVAGLSTPPQTSWVAEELLQPLREAVRESVVEVADTLSLSSVIQTIQEGNSLLTQGQLEMVAALDQESKTWREQLDRSVDSILERLGDRLQAEEDITPVVAAVDRAGERLVARLSLEPLLAAVHSEGERTTQSLQSVVETFASSRDLAVREAVSQVKDHIQTLLSEGISTELARGGCETTEIIDELTALILAETAQLTQSSQKVQNALLALQEEQQVSLQQVTDGLDGLTHRLDTIAQQIDTPSVEALVAAIRDEIGRYAEGQKQSLAPRQPAQSSQQARSSGVFVGQNGLKLPAHLLISPASIDGMSSAARRYLHPNGQEGGEVVPVGPVLRAGSPKAKDFIQLLTDLSQQLRDFVDLDTQSLEQSVDDLLQQLKGGANRADLPLVLELGRLGEEIGSLDLSEIDEGTLSDLDGILMGLALFLKSNVDAWLDEERAPNPSLPDSLDETEPSQQVQEMRKLFDAFEAQKTRQLRDHSTPAHVASKPNSPIEKSLSQPYPSKKGEDPLEKTSPGLQREGRGFQPEEEIVDMGGLLDSFVKGKGPRSRQTQQSRRPLSSNTIDRTS
ncbi:MAG: hypothetical protein HQL72_04025 [Magnetococcales bacterium]|nr:hypothetical protein [Magnetococcales bacterium]